MAKDKTKATKTKAHTDTKDKSKKAKAAQGADHIKKEAIGMKRQDSSAAAQGGKIQVVNTEGEVHTIDTSDPGSPFYGPVWARILTAKEQGQFIRGRATIRRISQADRFSGYMVDIDGVQVFLPASRAGYFYDPGCDACGKVMALKAESLYTNGPRAGTLTVNARSAINFVLNRQDPQAFRPGSAVCALAVDHCGDALIFQGPMGLIFTPMPMAQQVAWKKGMSPDPNDLTGYRWGIGIDGFGPQGQYATPLDVLPW